MQTLERYIDGEIEKDDGRGGKKVVSIALHIYVCELWLIEISKMGDVAEKTRRSFYCLKGHQIERKSSSCDYRSADSKGINNTSP